MCKQSKILLIIACVMEMISMILAASIALEDPSRASITRFKIDPWQENKYYFEYETSLGNSRKEAGFFKTNADGKKYLIIEGFYSYIGPDSKTYRVDYYADENGYHPTKKTETDQATFNTPSKTDSTLSAQERTAITPSPSFSINRQLPKAVIGSLLG